MDFADKTPIDKRDPFEEILDAVNKTRDSQLAMHEELKSYRTEILTLKARIQYPVVVCVVSAVVCLVSVLLRFG